MATFIYKQFNTDITWLHFFHIDLQADHILRLVMNLSEEELFEGIIALLIFAVAIFMVEITITIIMVVITVITIITVAIVITIITSWHPH